MVVHDDRAADRKSGILRRTEISADACRDDDKISRDQCAVSKKNAIAVDFRGTCSRIDFDAAVFRDRLDHRRSGGIQLPCHESGRALDDGHVDLCSAKRPGCLETQDTAADDRCGPDLRDHSLYFGCVFDGPDGHDFVEIMSLERRDKAVCAECIDQLVIGVCISADGHGLCLCVD